MLVGYVFGFISGSCLMFAIASLFNASARSEMMQHYTRIYCKISKCIDHYQEIQETVPSADGCGYLDGRIDGLNEALKCFEEDEE